jgi:3-oxoacyl-[acyl-carrier protein] reductase
MSGRLANKVVWITGSTQGIGRGVAHCCAAEGAAVIVSGRNEGAGRTVEEEIRSKGGTALYVACDVTSEEQCEASVAATVEQFGTLTGVVANASGYASWTSQSDAGKWVTELTLDAWNETIRTDLTGVFLTLKHAVRAMCKGDGGSVVTVSSHTAMEGVNGNDAYAAAKGGVIALTRGVASYYSRYNVRANCLAVGFVDSGPSVAGLKQAPELREMLYKHSLGRPGKPDDIGHACVYLLADESEYMSGAIIPIDGGSYAASHMHSPRERDLTQYERKRPVTPVFPSETAG